MGIFRNLAVTLVATMIMVAALVVLFPQPAYAAQVNLTAVGVSAPLNNAQQSFTVTANIAIPAGEHIPADFARVLVADSGVEYLSTGKPIDPDGDLVGPHECDARTAGSPGGATASIESFSGATLTDAAFSGGGYKVEAQGQGFVFTDVQDVDFGSGGYSSGNGFGAGDEGAVTLKVVVKVSNCLIDYSTNPREVWVQVFIGVDVDNSMKSFPVKLQMFDPEGASTDPEDATDNDNSIDKKQQTSKSGGETTNDITLTVPGEKKSINKGVTITANTGAETGASKFVGKTKAVLPEGTRISLSVQSGVTGANPNLGDPQYGVKDTAAAGQFSGDLGAYFQLKLNVPGSGDVNPADYFESVTIDLRLPKSYFDTRDVKDFRVRAFNNDGDLKPALDQPTVERATKAGDIYIFQVRIEHFSAFVAGVLAGGGGGPGLTSGGGGGGSGIDTGTATGTAGPGVDPGGDPTTSTSTTATTTTTTTATTTLAPITRTATATATDSVVVTVTEAPTPSTQGPPREGTGTGTVIGMVIGALALIGIVIAVAVTMRKKE